LSGRPIRVSNVLMMGVLNNDLEGIREEAVVAKFKNCGCVYWRHGGIPLNLVQGFWYKSKRRPR
jgi:hypothetical protein